MYRFTQAIQKLIVLLVLQAGIFITAVAQPGMGGMKWSKEGDSYYRSEAGDIVKYTLPANQKTVIADKTKLTPQGQSRPIPVRDFNFSADNQKILIYNNSKKVWRYQTRGDYWVLNTTNGELKKMGASLPASSLMFAKFSPDASKVAYVSGHNVYVEDIASGQIKQLTKDGTDKIINGTFDWVYEEEFDCRDGFRWSPDSKSIAYWQIDATNIRFFLMINNTDSIYPFTIPVEYPKVGESPSVCKLGVVDINTAATKWMNVPGDPRENYIPRMDWASGNELILQQLNRKQNETKIMLCNAATGAAQLIYTDKDEAWVDAGAEKWSWLKKGTEFLWTSDKDGWRHIYSIARDGKKETLLTKGNYDVVSFEGIDEKNNYVYFIASPDNATQRYLYRTKMDGKGKLELVSPADQKGTHNYSISANGLFASHNFSSSSILPMRELVSLPDHKALGDKPARPTPAGQDNDKVEFFKITTEDNVELDGWMIKPKNFDPAKKYPVVFYVYGEPATQTVTDQYGAAGNFLYQGDMAADGYIQISLDNRGTPGPKGRAWRKSIYRKIGIVNIRDQAMATKKILEWPYVDKDRIAVWGWSGGGSSTLNLMFQYPEIYKTGIAIAAVANQLSYDNIYQERYMGLPQENREDFVKGSPITYAKNLKGNLLYIHGTGDDNVHYQNAEMLVNELVKYNKQFQFMAYPNRTHNISEGPGTSQHLAALYTSYLRTHCPGGGK
jgi:dipeptidyl-peptidase 4